jgi:predicted ferric reductase
MTDMNVRLPAAPPPAATARTSPGRAGARLSRAPRPRLLDSDLAWVIGAYAAVIMGIWSFHGGLRQFTEGATGIATALTQLTGLAATAVGLAGLALVGRPTMIERRYGLDRMLVWHRILGEAMAVLIAVHVVVAVFEWQVDGQYANAIADLTGHEPYMAGATVGALLVGIVTISSLRAIRRHLAYETWWFVHLTAYLALALAFGHQIVTGADFADDAVARWTWIGFHVAVAAGIVWGRWGRVLTSVLFPLRVRHIERISPDVCTVHLSGRRLRRLRGSSGQFAFLRPLTGDGWWRCNPFSLSAAPRTDELRFTIKDRGDASQLITSLPVGTKVAVDGPYGATTPEVLHGRRVLFVVGGVGIAPARALLEDLAPAARPIVLYRAHHERDLLHLDELRQLARERGGEVLTLVGPSATLAVKDPFSAATLRRSVPDVAERVAVLCGPDRLVSAARSGLRAAGVAADDIHFEHAWW